MPALPPNVELRRAPDDNRELYRDGDDLVQPGHWEGLRLQNLECQAAGLPLVTTDAPPMNECRPSGPSRPPTPSWSSSWDQPVESHLVRPEALAEVLLELVGSDVGEASEQSPAISRGGDRWMSYRETLAAWLTA